MNKIYKVIYSKVRQCYVVVSEIARSHTKGPQRASVCGRKLASLAVAIATGFVFLSGYTGTASAADSILGGSYGGSENKTPGSRSAVISGTGNTTRGENSAIVGGSYNHTGTFAGVVIGGLRNVASAYVSSDTTIEGGYISNSVAVGGEGNTSLGGYSTSVGGEGGVVLGLHSTGIAGGSTDKLANYALAAGYGAVVTNNGVRRTANTVTTPSGPRTDYTYDQASTALGYQATANQPGTISFGHDAGDVSGYTVKWVEGATSGLHAVDNGDGSHTDYTVPPIITENHYDTAYYNRLVKIANGINSHDAVTMGQMATADNTKANVAADNIGSKLQVVKKDDSGNTVTDSTTGLPVMVDASDNEKTANETAWGTAIGTGTVAKDNGQLVTGGTVYNSMLTKANIDMDNISSNGKNVIRNLAKDAVKVVDGSHTYVTSKEDGNATAYSVNIKTGQVASGVSDLVTGGTVYDAIQNAKISGTGGANVDLTGKAEVGAGNVGANLSKFSADNLTDEQKLAEKRDNENDWGAALGTGAIANSDGSDADTNGSKQLVKGNTVYKEVRPTSDGTYVKTAQTTAQNLTALDKQAARSVLYDLAADQTVDKTKITLEGGTDGTTITNVKAGTADTDAVNFKQLKDKISDVTYTAGKGIDLSNKVISAKAGKGITLNDDGINVNLGNHLATDTNGAIHVLDNGVVEASNTDLVTGGTVYSALQKQKTDLTNNLSVNAGWGINIKDDTTTDENGKETTTKNVISLNRNLGTNYTDKKHKGNEKVTVATSATGLVLGGYAEDNGSESDPEVTYGATGDDSVTVGGKDALASGKGSVVTGGLDNVASGANATVVGGDYNDASGKQSIVLGGRDNNASGNNATVSGGYFNVASGDHAATLGGFSNYALGTGSVSIGGYGKNYTTGYDSSVNGIYSVGIAGGSTGDKADYSLAAGNQSVVTVANGTAIGYQATANKAGTIAFGHDAGDVSGYTVEWEKLPDGQYNADGTNYDYTKAPKSITGTTTYKDSAYNRLVKVADGVEDHDVVVMEQLKQYAEKNAGNIGNNIKVYKTDKNGNIQLGDDKKPSVDETATTKAKNDSKDAWGKALGAKTEDMSTSTAASNSDQLITGKTLYNYDKPNADGTYVKLNQTTGQNLSALDSQVAKNTTKLDDENHNIKYYSVKDKTPDDKLLPSIPGYLNDKNDGAKGAGSMAAGFNTHADGIASTVAGSYSGVINSKTDGLDLRGATALSYGTFNINQNTDATKAHSGVANSIIGQVNMTKNSNAAIIYGAGNIVTDSYRPIDEKKAAAILGSVNDPAQLGEAMKDAVESSGGQVMVMGGGNSVDKAYMTQVTGVGNKVNGKDSTYAEGTSTQYNFVDGFQNELTNGKHDYIIGSKNKVSGDSVDTNQSNIIFGDNHKLTNQQNNVIIGSSDTADDETTASNIVAIGHNAKVSAEGGVAIGSGSAVAASTEKVSGYDPTTKTQSADKTSHVWNATTGAVSIGTADGTVTRQLNGVAAGTNDTDAVNVAQLKKLEGMKANVNASNIGKNLKGADGNTASAEDITANEKAWGAALGTGDIATPKDMLVTDKAIHDELRPTTDGTYVKGSQTTAENLSKLDAQVKTNTDGISTNTTNITKNAGDITKLKNLSNITNEGRTVIKNLSKDAVKVTAGDRISVAEDVDSATGNKTYTVSAKNDGQVAAGDQNLVSGDTVNTAINNAITNAGTATDTKLAGKANVDATNIGKNLKGADGNTASAEDITANEKAWGAALGTGDIATPKDMLVTDKAIHDELRPTTDGTYVKGSQTTAENLSKLDAQVKTNTDGISTNTTNITKNAGDITKLKNLSNITNEGRTVIKNLSKDAVKVTAGDRISVAEDVDSATGNKTYTVSAKNDGQVAAGDQNLVSGDTVNTAINNAITNAGTATDTKLAGKANVDASNIGENMKDANGNKASDSEINKNKESWASAIGTNTVAKDNKQLVTSDAVATALEKKADKTYVDQELNKKADKTYVDEQLDTKANKSDVYTKDQTYSKSEVDSKVSDITTGLDGKAGKDLDNISDKGQQVIHNIAKDAVEVVDGTNTTVTKTEGTNTTPTKYAVNVEGKGKVASGDTGLISGDTLYNEVHVNTDGSYIKGSNTVGKNLSNLDTGLKTTSDLIHTNAKGDTIQIGGNSTATKVDISGKDSNGNTTGRVITGVVSDVSDPNSAANVGYVNGITSASNEQIYHDMNMQYNHVENDISRAAAGSNALAALHPMQEFDPDDKAQFALGYGHYRNSNAGAVGAFYQPDENSMVNFGVSFGNGDAGINAGVTFKFGPGGSGHHALTKTQMAKVIDAQSKEIDELKKDNADKDKRIDALEQKMTEILAKLDKSKD